MIFYAADLHFHYEPVVSDRPFENVEEMDEKLIENWNETVGDEDTVYVVGDLGYNNNHVPCECLERLKGHKHLIRGNHDCGFEDGELLYNYFETVTDFNEIDDGEHHVILCHYPMVHNKKSYMVHGHLHIVKGIYYETLKKLPQVLNAGVDINNYRPVTLQELIENNNRFFERSPEDCILHASGRPRVEGAIPVTPDFKPIPVKKD